MAVPSLFQRIMKKRLKKVKRPQSHRKFSPKVRRKARMGCHSIPQSVSRSSSGPQTESQMLAQIETLEARMQDAERDLVILGRKRQKLSKKFEYQKMILKIYKLKLCLQVQDELLATILKEKEELEMKVRNQNLARKELEEKIDVLQEAIGWRLLAPELEAEKEEWKKKYTDMVEFAPEFVSRFGKADAVVRSDSSLFLPTEVSEFMEYCGSFAEALRKHLETFDEV